MGNSEDSDWGACRGESGGGEGGRGDGDEVGGLVGQEQGRRNEEERRKDHSANSAPSWLRLDGLSFELSSSHPLFLPTWAPALTVKGSSAASRPGHIPYHYWAPVERGLEASPAQFLSVGPEAEFGKRAEGCSAGGQMPPPRGSLFCPSSGLLPKHPGPICLEKAECGYRCHQQPCSPIKCLIPRLCSLEATDGG